MRYLVLSDVHLGDPRFRSEELVSGLIKERNFDELILLGDFYDAWAEPDINNVLVKYKKLIEILRNMSKRVVWVVGNHEQAGEPWALKLRKILNWAEFKEKYVVGDCLFIHGQQIEKKGWNWFSRILYKIPYWGYRLTRIDWQSFFRRMLVKKCIRQQNSYVEKECVGRYKKLFLGHTHLPMHYKYKGVEVINSGDFVKHKSWVVLDGGEVILSGG